MHGESMITSLAISGFRCFPSLEVQLKPMTVCIGPNDTGKSTFLEALHLVAEKSRVQLAPGENPPGYVLVDGKHFKIPRPEDFYRNGAKYRIQADSDQGTSNVVGVAGEQVRASGAEIGPAYLFQLLPTGISGNSPGWGHLEPPPLGVHGAGLPTLLDYVLRTDRKRYNNLVSAIANRLKGITDINITTPGGGSRNLQAEYQEGLKLPFDRISTGSQFAIFFTALLFHPSPPKLLLIEEPENCIHPKMLEEVMAMLRSLTTNDRPVQVVLSTHSPYLLDCINIEEDQVLVFSRSEDGSRTAKEIDRGGVKQYLSDFMLGELWSHLGEERLAGEKAN